MDAIIKNKLLYAIYSPIVWVKLRLNGVITVGKSFWIGLPYISRHKKSTIQINGRCRFSGKQTSNPLGNNHKCMISTLRENAKVEIANGCGFSGITISCANSIKLYHNVRCGANVSIMDHDGHWDDFRSAEPKGIIIEDNVWVGANSIIMKGVVIGRCAVIGAGCVLRNSVPPYSIVIGNPSKIVGFNLNPEEIIEHERTLYPEEERLPLELLEKNYKKYFLDHIKEINAYTGLICK